MPEAGEVVVEGFGEGDLEVLAGTDHGSDRYDVTVLGDPDPFEFLRSTDIQA